MLSAQVFFEGVPLGEPPHFVRSSGVVATKKSGRKTYQVQLQQQFSKYGVVEGVQSFNDAPYTLGKPLPRTGTQTLPNGITRTVDVLYAATGGSVVTPAP